MNFKEKWPWFLLAFGVFISSLYQYGYWSVFGLNVFEYFQIQDILKAFIYVMLGAADPLMLMFIMYIIFIYDDKPQWLEKIRAEQTKDGKLVLYTVEELGPIEKIRFFILKTSKHYRMLLIVLLLSSFIFFDTIETYPSWIVTLLILLLSLELADRLNITSLNRKLRYLLLYAVLSLSWHSLLGGRKAAVRILNGTEFLYIPYRDIGNRLYKFKYLKYLGRTSDRYIFLSPDNKTRLLIKSDEIKSLNLRHLKLTVKKKTFFI